MTIRKIALKDAGRWVALQGEEMRKAALRGLYSAALRTQNHIVTEVIPQTVPHEPVDRGAYRAGWRVDKLDGVGAQIINTLPYASIVEDGARPGFKVGRKMIDALADWAYRKGIGTPKTVGANGEVKKGKKPKRGDAVYRQIAWAIAKAMSLRGMPGRKVFHRAAERIPHFIREEVERELRRLNE